MATRFLQDTQKMPRDPHSKGVQVLAAGLWRCATSSLQTAFEEKLSPPLTPSMHGAYVMPSVKAMQLCCAACREQDVRVRRKMLRDLFTGYNASSDYPGMAFVDDLLDMYPDAKLVLNKRSSARAWKASVDSSLRFFSSTTYMLLTIWIPQSYWHYRVYRDYKQLARRRFGTDDIFSEHYYERHNEWVRGLARRHGRELLEWEPSMGFEPLCRFVGREMPGGDFPQINEGEAIAKLKLYLVLRGLAAWAGAIGGLGMLCWAVIAIV